jgi:flagellar L-ring protein precursor FlgH
MNARRILFLSGVFVLLAVASFFLFPRAANAQRSLFADLKAYRVGDAITITLAERTAAERESQWERSSRGQVGSASGIDAGTALNGQFGLNATFQNDAARRNGSVQSDLLRGTMTAVIVGIDSLSGNLLVQGDRSLNVNGETHLMEVRGTVRPFDIQGDNSVFSFQLANANIVYKRAGGVKRALLGPGALTGIATVLAIGAAAYVGMQN